MHATSELNLQNEVCWSNTGSIKTKNLKIHIYVYTHAYKL